MSDKIIRAITPAEVRYGNKLLYKNKIVPVIGIHETTLRVKGLGDISILDFKPIPITKGLLKRYGFSIDKKGNEYIYYYDCEFTLRESLVGSPGYWYIYQVRMDGFKYIQYFHELQNVFFSLTGIELSTK